MINDIIVNLSVGAKANSASDYAISLAAALNAHLTGIIFLYGPTMPVSRAWLLRGFRCPPHVWRCSRLPLHKCLPARMHRSWPGKS